MLKIGISAGADYINNKIEGLGVKHRGIVGRRSLPHKKKSHGGGSLMPAGY